MYVFVFRELTGCLYMPVRSKVVPRYSRPLLPVWDAEGFLYVNVPLESFMYLQLKKLREDVLKKENSDEGTGKDLQSGGN